MGFLEILKTIGSSIVAAVLPTVGKQLVNVVNDVLDDDEDKLDENTATGEQVAEVFEKLPAETQALVLESEVAKQAMITQIAIAKGEQHLAMQRILLDAERKGAKVRPRVVAAMTVLVIVGLLMALFSQGYVIYMVVEFAQKHPTHLVNIHLIKQALPDVLVWGTILGFPCWVIRSYFGDRTEDKRIRASERSGVNIEAKSTLTNKIGDAITKKVLGK